MSHRPVTFNIRAPWWWLLLPLAQIALLCFVARPDGKNWAVYASFPAITALSSWRLFSDGRPYSLNKIWWLFCIVFLGLLPSWSLAVQMKGMQSTGASSMTMLHANGLILLCLGIYEGVRLWASRNFIPQPEAAPEPVSPVLIRQYAHLAPAMMLTGGMLLFIVLGYPGIFLEARLEEARSLHGSTFWLLFDKGLRGTMLWCCLAAIVLYRQHRLGKTTLLLVLIPGLLFNMPPAMPAYLALTIYLAWALAAGLPLFRRTHAFALVLLGAFLIIGPLVSGPRTEVAGGPTSSIQSFAGGDEAWTSIYRGMHHVAEAGSTNGRQLIGAILFFVPRSVWPSKPSGTGDFLLQRSGADSGNMPCTYIAEGYVNFGLLGSLVFTAVLALLIARYDGWYWRRGGRLRFTLPRLYYFAAMGLLFLILRGDLMKALAYAAGFALIFTFWQAIFFWRLKRNSETAQARAGEKDY